MFLLDTNVVSEARRGSKVAQSWLSGQIPTNLHCSVVVVSEVERGAAMIEGEKPEKAETFRAFLRELRKNYAGRIIPISEDIAETAGRFLATRTHGVHDCQIAATAFVHGLTLVTRNVTDFDDLPVPILNPWSLPARSAGT